MAPEPDDDLPPPLDTVDVSDPVGLRAALATAAPGTHIKLAPGVYEGNFGIERGPPRSGRPEAPICIFCETTLGAVITGRFTLAGDAVRLLKVSVRKGIVVDGDRAMVSRCRVDGSGGDPPIQVKGGANVAIKFCEFTGFGGRGIEVEGRAVAPLIYRNWIHDQSPTSGLEVAALIVGTSRNTSGLQIGAYVLENLVEALGARQAIEFKSEGNSAQGNCCVGTQARPADMIGRHGRRNLYISNWLENARLLVGDQGSIAIRNRAIGTRHRPCVGVKAGTITGDQLRGGRKGYPISEGAWMIANEALLDIGWKFDSWSLKPLATSVEAHDQTRYPLRRTYVDETQVTVSPTTSSPLRPAAPRRLTAADVGPFADPNLPV